MWWNPGLYPSVYNVPPGQEAWRLGNCGIQIDVIIVGTHNHSDRYDAKLFIASPRTLVFRLAMARHEEYW